MQTTTRIRRRRAIAAAAVLAGGLIALETSGATRADTQPKVVFGLPSHAGLLRLAAAPANVAVTLQLGLVADQKGIALDARAAADPSSSTYGHYLTLAQLSSRHGAPPARRRAVLAALRAVGSRGMVDMTGLRVTAQTTIGRLERLFGTTWSVYGTPASPVAVALPDRQPQVPDGLRGNVDVVAGATPFLVRQLRAAPALDSPIPTGGGPFAGGTPTRTGTVGSNCLSKVDPSALEAPVGLFPDQIATAYGIDALHRQGLHGEGVRLAIVGEAPTSAADLAAFRGCFGLTGTPLRTHGGANVQPILESSLDTMVASAVAPKLASFDLWVRPLNVVSEDADVGGFLQLLGAPLEAARTGNALPDVVSVSYGVCEAQVAPFTAARTLVDRTLAAYASLGITVVVAAGDSGSSTCARGIPTKQLTAADKAPRVSWPASSPWVLAVGGTNLTLDPANGIASTGVWNDTTYPKPFTSLGAGGGGVSLLASRPAWQPATSFGRAGARLVPDVSAFADATPGYAIVCSANVDGCAQKRMGQTLAVVGGTSAAAPLVAGMIALWIEKARAAGLPRVGFVPPLLYSLAQSNPNAFTDITLGNNKIFDVSCCDARPGYDLASGIGSPRADAVADALPH